MSKRLVGRLRFIIEKGERRVYCEIKDGKRWRPIAKRGSGERWTSLDPNYAVSGCEPGDNNGHLTVDYVPEETHRYANSVRNAETGEYFRFEASKGEGVVRGAVAKIPPGRTLHGPFATRAKCLEDQRHVFETELGAPLRNVDLTEH
jgi:hypothetical protein